MFISVFIVWFIRLGVCFCPELPVIVALMVMLLKGVEKTMAESG